MTGNEYQALAMRTANTGLTPYDNLIVGALGLAGESGEVADLVKKFIGQGHELDREQVMDEVSDVLWYVALTLKAIGKTVDECMQHNVDKLKARYPDGFSPERSIHREA